MVSWWMPYLDKGTGLTSVMARSDSNCSCILGPQRLFEFDLNNGLSPGHSNVGSDGSMPVEVSHLWSSGGCNIWPRAPGLT